MCIFLMQLIKFIPKKGYMSSAINYRNCFFSKHFPFMRSSLIYGVDGIVKNQSRSLNIVIRSKTLFWLKFHSSCNNSSIRIIFFWINWTLRCAKRCIDLVWKSFLIEDPLCLADSLTVVMCDKHLFSSLYFFMVVLRKWQSQIRGFWWTNWNTIDFQSIFGFITFFDK